MNLTKQKFLDGINEAKDFFKSELSSDTESREKVELLDKFVNDLNKNDAFTVTLKGQTVLNIAVLNSIENSKQYADANDFSGFLKSLDKNKLKEFLENFKKQFSQYVHDLDRNSILENVRNYSNAKPIIDAENISLLITLLTAVIVIGFLIKPIMNLIKGKADLLSSQNWEIIVTFVTACITIMAFAAFLLCGVIRKKKYNIRRKDMSDIKDFIKKLNNEDRSDRDNDSQNLMHGECAHDAGEINANRIENQKNIKVKNVNSGNTNITENSNNTTNNNHITKNSNNTNSGLVVLGIVAVVVLAVVAIIGTLVFFIKGASLR